MGIKNLFKFIQKYTKNTINIKNIKDYQGKTLGIDANLLLYKMIYAIRARGYDIKNQDIIVTHIHSLLLKLSAFKKYKIIPIFVFDNYPSEIKTNALETRKKSKYNMINKYKNSKTEKGKRIYYYIKSNITKKEIEDCKKLINIFGYTNIESLEEADAQLASLYKSGMIDYIVSDDLDILLFGGEKIIKNFSVDQREKLIEINLRGLLKETKLTKDQLIDLGILMGSDYCDNKPMSYNKSYELIKKYESIRNMPKNIFDYSCEKAQKYFKNPPVHLIKKINKYEFDQKKLINFLVSFKFNNKYIDNIINKNK